MNHAERIQELSLRLPSTCTRQVFSQLSSRVPQLQKLEIWVADPLFELSPVLFLGDTPALHALELQNCPMPWYTLELSGLTTLSLHGVPGWLRQNVEDLLATLSYMQCLTHLHIEDALRSAAYFLSSGAFHTFQKIDLPRLSHLFIVAPLSVVGVLLSCVNFPLETEVRLECNLECASSLGHYPCCVRFLRKDSVCSKTRLFQAPQFAA